MKIVFADFGRRMPIRRADGGTATLWMVSLAVLAALILLLYFGLRSGGPGPDSTTFSPATQKTLNHLTTPVEVRFYSVLDTETVDPALGSYAERVARMLKGYRDASDGKVSIRVIDQQSDSNAEAALAEGLRAFNREKGGVSFLGLVVEAGNQREVLPLLNPEFESALEADITRAISRASETANAFRGPAEQNEPEPATLENVKAAVPNYQSIPLETGTQVLREAMLAELQKAGEENNARIAAAQANLEKARQSGSQAEQEAAKKALSEAEREHVNRIQDIVGKTTARISALEKLKTTGQ